MRSSKPVALVTILMLVTMTALGTAFATQGEESPTNPALYDLELAQGQLDAHHVEVERLRSELEGLLDEIDGLTISRDFIELNNKGRNDAMQAARTRARNMAINAYIGIGPPLSGAVVLDADSANDLTYRNGLLRQQAERLQDAAHTYTVLVGEADERVLGLGDSINDQIRRTEALNRALTRQLELIPNVEWIVSIAAIHNEADAAFIESGRAQPSGEQWHKLRHCESTNTYNIDLGSGFFGAYQFEEQTWRTVGGQDNPAHAPPEEQDARARLLYATRGSQPWPVCGRYLP